MKKFLSLLLSLSLLFSLPVWAEEPEADQPVESSQPVESAPCTFPDMEHHWARDVVEKYVAMGVIGGYEDGTFRPDNLVTRAEAAKILTLTFGLEEPEEIRYTDLMGVEWTEYTDLKGTEWHYKYDISAAKYLSLNVSPAWSANIELLQPYDRNFWEPRGPGTAGRFLPYANMARYQLADTLVEYLAEREGLATTVPSTPGGSYALIENAFPNEDHPYVGTKPGGGISKSERRLYDRLWIAYEQGIVVGGDGYLRSFDAVTRAELLTTLDRVLAREQKNSETE